MSNKVMKLAAFSAVAALALAGCGNSSSSTPAATPAATTAATSAPATGASSSASATSAPSAVVSATGGTATGSGKVGVILPDSVTSKRWENNDRPALTKAFADAGLTSDIQNAEKSTSKWLQICDAMINEKVKVLLEVDLDAASAKTCITKAHAQGIKVIDYDRFSIGGGADYYVSFDNVQVGKLQGQGLVDCLTAAGTKNPAIVEIDGDSTDNNATLFAQGYNSVLDPLYANKTYTKVGEQTGKWDPVVAKTVWQAFYTQTSGKINGAIIANDGMGDGVATAMKAEGVLGKIPFTGQDAQDTGLARILLGQQCMTVFKDASLETALASKLAIAIIKNTPTTAITNTTITDPTTKKSVPFAAATPETITKKNVEDVIKTGYTTAAKVCAIAGAAACKAGGVS
jgi:D-xylose transport system substrate-binding protein